MQLLTPTAVSCPPKKVPNSDKEDGIFGKVGDSVSVTCNGRASFAVRCLGVGPGEAIWTGFEPCPGVLRFDFLRTHG